MKKANDFSKKNEENEFKKKTIKKYSYHKTFVNPIAEKYRDHLDMKLYQKRKQIQPNDDGIKYYDIYDVCFTKKELIKEYDFFKKKEYKETSTWLFKKLNAEELKYWREEIPKLFETETKDFIIKWFLTMTHYPVKIQYNRNPKYIALVKKMHIKNKTVHHSLDM